MHKHFILFHYLSRVHGKNSGSKKPYTLSFKSWRLFAESIEASHDESMNKVNNWTWISYRRLFCQPLFMCCYIITIYFITIYLYTYVHLNKGRNE